MSEMTSTCSSSIHRPKLQAMQGRYSNPQYQPMHDPAFFCIDAMPCTAEHHVIVSSPLQTGPVTLSEAPHQGSLSDVRMAHERASGHLLGLERGVGTPRDKSKVHPRSASAFPILTQILNPPVHVFRTLGISTSAIRYDLITKCLLPQIIWKNGICCETH